MTLPDPNKASVLWNKGQNFFSAFFAEIDQVRRQIGNDTVFARWCFDELHIPLVAITRVTEVLTIVDGQIAKAHLASAKAAEQAQRRKEREQREAMIAAERKRKEEERAAIAAEKARREELERLAVEAADKLRRKQMSKRKNNKGWKEKERAATAQALAVFAGTGDAQNVVVFENPQTPTRTEGQLVKLIKAALLRRDASRSEWIDASVELAGLLCEARRRYPANERFSKWLEENDIVIDRNDRAALLQLGQNVKAMRVILERTDSTSYRYIWQDVHKQITAN